MFGAVLALRLLDGDAAENAISLLYTLPVALAAVTFGRRGGITSGLVAVALVAVWVVVSDVDLSWLGWLTRLVPLLLLGTLLGDASERLTREQRRRSELEAAAQRHRDAAEISDSLLQGMSAAKWAIEAERHDLAAQTLEETINKGQRLVSDLLRGADLAPGRSAARPPD
jgi:signal transduction histidine kinase